MARLVARFRALATTSEVVHPGVESANLPPVRGVVVGKWRSKYEHAEEDLRRLADDDIFRYGDIDKKFVKDRGSTA